MKRRKDLPAVPSAVARRLCCAAVLSIFLIASTLSGCRWFSGETLPSLPSEPPASSGPNDTPPGANPSIEAHEDAGSADSRSVLSRVGWIRAVPPPGRPDVEPDHRWRYPELDDLLAAPQGERPNFHAALSDEDPVVVANAAIALARCGEGSAVEALARAVRTPDLKMPLRAAAAEALGRIRDPSPVPSLEQLIDQYGQSKRGASAHPIPELHAELIRGLARHVDPANDPRFLDALRSPSAEVRLAALRAWACGRPGNLPVEAANLRLNADGRVRAAALACLARLHYPSSLDCLTSALEDHDLRVRLAAVQGLGELATAEARAALKLLLDDRAERTRAAAVSALAELGDERPVMDAADDPSWRVRLEVARALAHLPNPKGVALAGDLVADSSSVVRSQIVDSVGRWPLRQAGPILLDVMGRAGYLTRKNAAEHLAVVWPPAAEFPVDGSSNQRTESLKHLRTRFRQEIGFIDPDSLAAGAGRRPPASTSPERIARVQRAVQSLHGSVGYVSPEAMAEFAAIGPEVVGIIEHLVLDRHMTFSETIYTNVLPQYDPAFAALDRLASPTVSDRRRAAAELLDLAQERRLGRLAAARLATVVVHESDASVWQSVLKAAEGNPSEPAIRLAYAAIGHPATEVRRLACRNLATCPNPRHVKVLLPVLEDSRPTVVQEALRALGASGGIHHRDPLMRLLASRHESIRVQAAAALARLGDPSGNAALERLAYSGDRTIRRAVAEAMGDLADSRFVPWLIHLLDDHHTVRSAALASLPRAAGRDVADGAPPGRDLAERIAAWKRWFRRQPTTLGMDVSPNGLPRRGF
ncbi:MAG: HEAT repeat domain-containing protein [Planctomycetota bacterium]|jgi:HEAT repeat protein